MAPRRRWKQTDQSWLCLQVIAWDKAVTRGSRTHSYRKILLCALCAFFSLQIFEPHRVHVPQGLNHHKPALYSLAQGLQIARTVPGRSPMGSVFYTRLWVVLNHPLKLPCSWVPLVFGQLLALDKTGQRKKTQNSWGFLLNRDNLFPLLYSVCWKHQRRDLEYKDLYWKWLSPNREFGAMFWSGFQGGF